MKIGILTFHHTNNYGGSLQAVGLVQCLRSMGHEAGVVDYRPWKIHSRYIKSCVPGFSKVMSHVNQAGINELYAATITEAKNRLKKLSRMNEWVRINGMAISPPIWTHSGLVDAMNRLDLIVLGSDEIWKMKRKGGIDLAYFNGLKGVSTPAMSYAASVGESKSFGTYKDEIGSYLKMLIAIGVRDERTMKLLIPHFI
jgi:polysaccharide pyruvyl transferase WcaK-like protein